MRLDRLVRIANQAKTDAQRNRVGEVLLELMRCSPEALLYKKTPKITRGVEKVGEGAYGAVFYGCLDDECHTRVAIKFSKKSLKSEYEIGKKLSELGVAPRVYLYGYCQSKKMEYMYYEYASHGSVEDFVKKHGKTLRASDYKAILYQVYKLLRKVHRVYPSYRHYDLHPGNVLVNNVRGKMRLLLSDFGMSEMKGIRSPLLTKSWKKEQAPDAFVFIYYLAKEDVRPPTAKAFLKAFSEREYDSQTSSVDVIADAMKYPFMKGRITALTPVKLH